MLENLKRWAISIRAAYSGRFTDYVRNVSIKEEFMVDKSFAERAKELVDSATNVNEKINQTLCQEFGMPSDKVSRWFKSLFGKTIRDALKDKFKISREALENALLISNNVKEMQALLGVSSNSSAWKGLLDREFGYSTYASAKTNFLLRRTVAAYNPNRDDNFSIICSQFLGDAHFDKTRRAMVITHGMSQAEYLMFKVSLINKAYPESAPISKITKRVHQQGHEYVSWYSGNFSESTFNRVVNSSYKEIFEELTPLGWCLWYLDGGGYYCYPSKEKNSSIHKIEIYVHNDECRDAAVAALKQLGFDPNQTKAGSIVFQDIVQCAKFLNTFVKPFDHIIPACMKYKYDMKI